MSRFVEEDLPLVRAVEGEAPPLRPVSVRPPLPVYLKQLWQRRHFMRKQAWGQAMGQHQGTLLGNLWLVIAPLLDGMVYFLIFGIMFPGARRGVDNFFGYLIIGIFLITFTSRSLTSCTRSLETGRGLMKAFSFPRASLPLAAVWRELIALMPTIYVLVILLLIVPPKATLGWVWFLFPAVVALQLLLNAGLGLILARLGASFPDLKHLVPYFTRILMYASCVMWTIDRFDAFPDPVPEIARNNPFFIVLDMCRDILLDAQMPPTEHWVKLAAWAVGSVLFGIVFFWQAEVKYARNAFQ